MDNGGGDGYNNAFGKYIFLNYMKVAKPPEKNL